MWQKLNWNMILESSGTIYHAIWHELETNRVHRINKSKFYNYDSFMSCTSIFFQLQYAEYANECIVFLDYRCVEQVSIRRTDPQCRRTHTHAYDFSIRWHSIFEPRNYLFTHLEWKNANGGKIYIGYWCDRKSRFPRSFINSVVVRV